MTSLLSNDRPRRRQHAATWGGVALLLGASFAVTGCTESVAAPEPGEGQSLEPLTLEVIDDGDGKKAVVVEAGESMTDVKDPETMTSTLDVGPGSCYYISRDGGPPPTLLVFPPDTSLVAGEVPSVVVDGQRFPDGTLISVTGQRVQLSPENLDQAEPCEATAGAFFVTSASGAQEPEADESSSS